MPLRVGLSRRVVLGPQIPAPEVRRLLSAAARTTLRSQGHDQAELSLTLLDDDEIRRLNARWLGHDQPTDVIAFALHDEGEPPLGDIYLGIEQAERQARENDVPLREELVRLTVHGTLHVLGHEHPAGADRERCEMWQLQERIVRDVLGGPNAEGDRHELV